MTLFYLYNPKNFIPDGWEKAIAGEELKKRKRKKSAIGKPTEIVTTIAKEMLTEGKEGTTQPFTNELQSKVREFVGTTAKLAMFTPEFFGRAENLAKKIRELSERAHLESERVRLAEEILRMEEEEILAVMILLN